MASVQAIRRAGAIAQVTLLGTLTVLPVSFLAWQYSLASRYAFAPARFTVGDELHGSFVIVSRPGRAPPAVEINGIRALDTVTPFGDEPFGLHEHGVPEGVPMTVKLATYRMGTLRAEVVADVRSADRVFVERTAADCAALARRATRRSLGLGTGFVAAWLAGLWGIAMHAWWTHRRRRA